ncbi:hypothetical protein [Phenylobacterium sp.]
MRPMTMVLVTLAAIALTAVVWVASGGRAFVFVLPLIALPLLMRRRG